MINKLNILYIDYFYKLMIKSFHNLRRFRMTEIQLTGLFLNFIIYLIMIFPVIIISLNKKNYENKNHFISIVIFSFIIEIILSFSLYKFSPNIFSFFSNTPGIVNYSVYASKILFISSSLFGIKVLFPIYLIQNNMKKKSAILVLSKIAVLLIFILIGYNLFNFKGFLFAFPVSDLIFYIIYIIVFLNIIR